MSRAEASAPSPQLARSLVSGVLVFSSSREGGDKSTGAHCTGERGRSVGVGSFRRQGGQSSSSCRSSGSQSRARYVPPRRLALGSILLHRVAGPRGRRRRAHLSVWFALRDPARPQTSCGAKKSARDGPGYEHRSIERRHVPHLPCATNCALTTRAFTPQDELLPLSAERECAQTSSRLSLSLWRHRGPVVAHACFPDS